MCVCVCATITLSYFGHRHRRWICCPVSSGVQMDKLLQQIYNFLIVTAVQRIWKSEHIANPWANRPHYIVWCMCVCVRLIRKTANSTLTRPTIRLNELVFMAWLHVWLHAHLFLCRPPPCNRSLSEKFMHMIPKSILTILPTKSWNFSLKTCSNNMHYTCLAGMTQVLRACSFWRRFPSIFSDVSEQQRAKKAGKKTVAEMNRSAWHYLSFRFQMKFFKQTTNRGWRKKRERNL